MMTTEQPNALRLAKWLDAMPSSGYALTNQAAAELRRLHEVNPNDFANMIKQVIALAEQPANVAAVNTSSERVDKTEENVHEKPAKQPICGLDVYMDPNDGLKPKLFPKQPAQDQGQSCYCPNCEALSKELAALKTQQQEPVDTDWDAVHEKLIEVWNRQISADEGLDEIQDLIYTSPQPANQVGDINVADIPKIGCVNHDCDKCKAQQHQALVAWMKDCADFWEHYTYISEASQENYKAEAQMWVEKLRTSPPASKPLPFNKEDMEGLDVNQRLGFKLGWKSAEEAHGIKGDA